AVVGLARARLSNGVGDVEGWDGANGVNEGGGRIGHGEHVRSFNRLPASDGGTVKAETLFKALFGQFGNGTTKVLPGAEGVDEFDIEHLSALLAGHLEDAPGRR